MLQLCRNRGLTFSGRKSLLQYEKTSMIAAGVKRDTSFRETSFRSFLLGRESNTRRKVSVSRHLPYECSDVFSVVKNVQHYPDFLPYCTNCEIQGMCNS